MRLAEYRGLKGSIAFPADVLGQSDILDQMTGWAEGTDKKNRHAAERFFAIARTWAEKGLRPQERGFWRIIRGSSPQIQEWRIGHDWRIFFYRDGTRLVLLRLTKKERDREKAAIESAESAAKRYIANLDRGDLTIDNLGGL